MAIVQLQAVNSHSMSSSCCPSSEILQGGSIRADNVTPADDGEDTRASGLDWVLACVWGALGGIEWARGTLTSPVVVPIMATLNAQEAVVPRLHGSGSTT